MRARTWEGTGPLSGVEFVVVVRHFLLHDPIVIVRSRRCVGGGLLFPLLLLCCDSLWWCAHIISLVAVSLWMTGLVGIRRKKRKGHMSGQVRQEELLAKAVVIEARRDWHCRFGSETNVWSRCKIRRCKTDIPAGVHATNLQALSARNVSSCLASSSSCDGEDQVLAVNVQLVKNTELRD